MKSFLISFFITVFLLPIYSQTYLGDYTSYTAEGNSVQVFAGSSSLRFIFYKPDLVRVDYLPALSTLFDSSFVIIRDTTELVALTIIDSSDSLQIISSKMKIICRKFPLRVTYLNNLNQELLSEPSWGGIAFNGSERIVNFNLTPDNHFYGTGERGTSLDKRGQSFLSYNTQIGGYTSPLPTMNINIPLLANTKGYAIYFENTHPGYYDLGNTNPGYFSYTASEGELSYFLIVSETISGQLSLYTWLTGTQPLPPRWAFGYIQSKYGYQNEAEARYVVQTLRQRDIPADGLILDLYWFQHMGDISWDFTNWPDPFQMMSDFLDEGIKTIVITEPYITEYSFNYQSAIANNYLAFNSSDQSYILSNWWSCGCNAGLLDLTNPFARQWWWNKHPSFYGNELSGIWTDLGEPENHPEGMNHFLGNRDKVHNIFNLLWAETIFNGFAQLRPNKRVFNLTRSGYAGIQRYGVIPWSGDVGKDFGGLAVQIPMVLNMGMSGLAYHNSDIGGFCCGYTTPELYVRWMQYGTFCPITRAHGVSQPTEPWGYGNEAESICRKYIELRYELLPYIYTLAHENYKSGMPLLRPLFFDDPDDQTLINYSESYLFGDKLLVSPVITANAQSKSIYLPSGKWIYFWNDTYYEGGQNYNIKTPLDILPIFVKAGSIIPMAPVMNYTDEYLLDTLILNIYPDVDQIAEFDLYEDDGSTLDYQKGSYAETHISQVLSNQSLSILIGQAVGSFVGKVSERTYLSKIHLISDSPSSVFKTSNEIAKRNSYFDLRNNPEGYFFDSQNNVLYIQVKGSTDSSYTLLAENVTLGSVELKSTIPYSYSLNQNFPNPFNSSTKIIYTIGIEGPVTLKLFDILGNEILTLVSEHKVAGKYEVNFDAGNLSSGVYFYQLRSSNFFDTKKLIILK